MQTWFHEEEQKLLSDVEAKIDNLDARNLRQLNQLYGEIKKLEGMCVHLSVCVCVCVFFCMCVYMYMYVYVYVIIGLVQ